MRLFPNLVVMAPGDELDVAPMLHFALAHAARRRMRYPKANLEKVERAVAPVELGQAEVHEWGSDGMLVAFGTLVPDLRQGGGEAARGGSDVGVINARFAKPLDKATLLRAIEEVPLVVTVEEGTLEGGFGSALWKPPTPPAWTRATSSAWACRIASSSTANAANCWPIWASTCRASARRMEGALGREAPARTAWRRGERRR